MVAHMGIGPYTSRRFGVSQVQGRTLVDFTSWDIFELGRNQRVVDAVHREVELEGLGGSSSRMLGGYSPALHSAELRWARFVGVESAILISSRNQALFSLITQRVGPGGEILMFAGGSAPIAELAELCGASLIPVTWDGLPRTIKELGPKREGIGRFFFLEVGHPFIQFEIDYSSLLELLTAEGIELLIDETYSLGILGSAGGGLFDLLGRPQTYMVGMAGLDAVIGVPSLAVLYGRSSALMEISKLSSVLKSEPPPGPMVAAASEAVCRQVQVMGAQRIELRDRVKGFQELLYDLSGAASLVHNHCCLTIRLPSLSAGVAFQGGLIQQGYLCGVFQTTLERDASCVVQFVVSIFHSEQVLRSAARAIARVLRVGVVEAE